MDELHELLSTMLVPLFRRDDLPWLNRNLGIMNREHPDYPRAMEIIKLKLREG
jgi:hypothetical protein